MKKISRNDPCPCNSGRKYKYCCQKRDEAKAATQVATQVTNVRPQVSPHPSIPEYLQLAIEYHKAGHLPQAEAMYQRILQVAPDHPGALHFLGLIAKQVGKYEIAVELISKALVFKPDYADAHSNLGNALKDQGRLDEAVASYRNALTFKPDSAEVYANLGNALKEQGKLDAAIASYHKALVFKADFAEVHCILGNALNEQGKLDEAIASYRKALRYMPDLAEAHNNLGNVLNEQGRLESAVASFHKALMCKPDFAEAHSNLGNALREQGNLDDAVASYRKALAYRPDYAEAYSNLGNVLREQGKLDEAVSSYQRALQIRESPEIKSGFANCIRNVYFTHEIMGIRPLVTQAISEPWGRPAELANPAISLIKLNLGIKECIDRATTAWATGLPWQELFGSPVGSGFASVYDDLLLRSLLENTTVCDVELERFLTMARKVMLDNAISEENTGVTEGMFPTIFSTVSSNVREEKILTFYCALARQCFINEYIFVYSDQEFDRAQLLRERLAAALAARLPVPVLWVVAVAAYFPLISVPSIEILLDQPWSVDMSAMPAVVALLAQQVQEPMEERRYRSLIPRLTPVTGEVSRLVQKQYEENPYPRWVKFPPGGKAISINSYLRKRFPFSQFELTDSIDKMGDRIDILVAGCGTGQHSIATAQRYQNARILAIDLSLTSLCYAKRKTREIGLENVEYAQADIMALSSAGRTFDIIESVGVLHHLADPIAGWRQLLSLLRPDGFMRLGFYSEHARQNETAAKGFITEHGYKPIPEDIRRCRQDLMSMENAVHFKQILSVRDFYGMSECRDLLFHVQEHRYTLPQLKENLRQLDLTFIGFSLDPDIIKRYMKRFPADQSQIDLDSWHVFETENLDTFTGMYQFWVQKRD
jgi:tetratricopeptide (TPR) repeat protein/SAM-dependent methyltransferase